MSGVCTGVVLNTVAESYKLPGFASVFQTTLLAILKVCRWLARNSSPKPNTVILIYSQMEIKAWYSVTISSRLVGQCIDALAHWALEVILLWDRGHRNIKEIDGDRLGRWRSAKIRSISTQ